MKEKAREYRQLSEERLADWWNGCYGYGWQGQHPAPAPGTVYRFARMIEEHVLRKVQPRRKRRGKEAINGR